MEITVKMANMECSACHCAYTITEAMHERCLDVGETWYCPNGHSQVYKGNKLSKANNKIQNLKKEVASLNDSLEFWRSYCKEAEEKRDHYFRRINSLRGHITRMKKKI